MNHQQYESKAESGLLLVQCLLSSLEEYLHHLQSVPAACYNSFSGISKLQYHKQDCQSPLHKHQTHPYKQEKQHAFLDSQHQNLQGS